MRISALALQYVPAQVVLRESGVYPNISTDAVRMAFPVAEVAPIAGDWKAATWETDATTVPTRYIARCNVGPGGTVTLAAGLYDVWVEVTHAPELVKIQTREKLEVY